MNAATEKRIIDGLVGKIELAIDQPDPTQYAAPRGWAIVTHPHPLFGGTLDNKVTQTIARACVQAGLYVVRPNFRGVGDTQGTHDAGPGETADVLHVYQTILQEQPVLQTLPLILGGFSFGSFVQTRVAEQLRDTGVEPRTLLLVGTATSRWPVANVPQESLVVHGELDDTVPLSSVFDWARPQELPVIVVPGADHFFHRKLPLLKRLISDHLFHTLTRPA